MEIGSGGAGFWGWERPGGLTREFWAVFGVGLEIYCLGVASAGEGVVLYPTFPQTARRNGYTGGLGIRGPYGEGLRYDSQGQMRGAGRCGNNEDGGGGHPSQKPWRPWLPGWSAGC